MTDTVVSERTYISLSDEAAEALPWPMLNETAGYAAYRAWFERYGRTIKAAISEPKQMASIGEFVAQSREQLGQHAQVAQRGEVDPQLVAAAEVKLHAQRLTHAMQSDALAGCEIKLEVFGAMDGKMIITIPVPRVMVPPSVHVRVTRPAEEL